MPWEQPGLSNTSSNGTYTVAFSFSSSVTLSVAHFSTDTVAFAESLTRTDANDEPFPDAIGLSIREGQRHQPDPQRAAL